jgi:hypothetical protein
MPGIGLEIDLSICSTLMFQSLGMISGRTALL